MSNLAFQFAFFGAGFLQGSAFPTNQPSLASPASRPRNGILANISDSAHRICRLQHAVSPHLMNAQHGGTPGSTGRGTPLPHPSELSDAFGVLLSPSCHFAIYLYTSTTELAALLLLCLPPQNTFWQSSLFSIANQIITPTQVLFYLRTYLKTSRAGVTLQLASRAPASTRRKITETLPTFPVDSCLKKQEDTCIAKQSNQPRRRKAYLALNFLPHPPVTRDLIHLRAGFALNGSASVTARH